VRNADKFAPPACSASPEQRLWMRRDGMSEDCLYLNVWTSAKTGKEKLPVLSISRRRLPEWRRLEPATTAGHGRKASWVSINYRTNIFGFSPIPN